MNDKVVRQLVGSVGYPVDVTLRSNPEALLSGILSGFDLGLRLLTVSHEKGVFFVNLDDLSVIRSQVRSN